MFVFRCGYIYIIVMFLLGDKIFDCLVVVFFILSIVIWMKFIVVGFVVIWSVVSRSVICVIIV